jgi:hypothetical protein
MSPYIRNVSRRRRGITSVLAMLFLVLIATLALGFYSTVTTSTSIAGNDRRTAKALMSAESGLQFMRYQLAKVTIPPSTSTANLLQELYDDLSVSDDILGNLQSGATIVKSGNTILIPAESNKMILTNATENNGFRIVITDVGSVGEVVCTVTGMSGANIVSTKGVRLDFSRQPIETAVFDYGVAARGRVVIQKGTVGGVSGISADTIANIMSARGNSGSLAISGGTVGGNLGVLDSKSNATITGGTVHGTSNLTNIYNNYLQVVAEPEFPVIDTTAFAAYATNPYVAGSTTISNVRIPANTNPNFTGNMNIQGILYVESPNKITFQGNTTLAGFIVVEGTNDSTANTITMSGNFSVANVPADSQFDSVRAITGVAVVAPTTKLTMTGSADSQFRGNIIVGKFNNAGSADIQIDKGSIVGMDTIGDAVVLNGKTVRFTSTGKDNQPSAGVTYTEKFTPSKGSYLELN